MANTHSATLASSAAFVTTDNFAQTAIDTMTVMGWHKTSTTNGTTLTIAINDGGISTWQIYKTSTTYKFNCATLITNADSPTIAEGDIEDGEWHHLAGVYDGSKVRFFLDTVEQGTGTTMTGNIRIDRADQMGIGCRNGGGSPGLFFVGQMDDVRVYNTAKIASEIAADYQKELVGDEAGLIGYWKLNNNNDDEHSNNNDLIDVNSPTFTTDPAFIETIEYGVDTSSTNFSKKIKMIGY